MFLSPLLQLQRDIFISLKVHCVLCVIRLEFAPWNINKNLCTAKTFFTKAETQQTKECCWAWPYFPSTPPHPCWGWSQGRTPMATTAVRCCFHDAEEWLVSWIRTVLSDSAEGWRDSVTPGRRNTGRMWTVTEQGHSKGHCKTCHPPSSLSLRNLQTGLVLHMENIVSEFILCLESDLGFVCLCVKWWWICRQQCPGLKGGEKKNMQAKTARRPLSQGMFLFWLWTVWCH